MVQPFGGRTKKSASNTQPFKVVTPLLFKTVMNKAIKMTIKLNVYIFSYIDK